MTSLAHNIFVGREQEHGELRAALKDTLAGHGRLTLLTGEPGIGKTRLAEEFAGTAQRQGACVLWGRCWEADGAPLFWPWAQIVRSYIQTCSPEELPQKIEAGAADIAAVVPAMGKRISGLRLPSAIDSAPARFHLFECFATFFKNAGTHTPLVLILDDLHWADPLSLLLLHFLARELREARVFVIGTYRDVEVHPRHPLAELLSRLTGESPLGTPRTLRNRPVALHQGHDGNYP